MRLFFAKTWRNIKIRWEKYPSLRYFFYFFSSFLILWGIFSINMIPGQFRPKVGERSPQDYLAPSRMEVVDRLATEEARQKAEYSIPFIYSINPSKFLTAKRQIQKFFNDINQVGSQNIPIDRKINILRRVMPFPISENTFLTLLSASHDARQAIEMESLDILRKVMDKGVKTNDIPVARIEIERMAKSVPEPGSYVEAITELAQEALKPNDFPDFASMDARRAQIEEYYREHPIMREISRGTPIVAKGEIITQDKLDILRQAGYVSTTAGKLSAIGFAILSLFFLGIITFYLVHFHKDILKAEKQLFLFQAIFLITALISKFAVVVSGFLAPVAMASVLICLLYDSALSLMATLVLSLIVGLLTNQVQALIVAFVGGCVAIFGASRSSNRFHLFSTSFVVMLANVAAILSFALLESESPFSSPIFGYNAFFGAINGLLSVSVAALVLPLLEYFSETATHFRLLELANPNEPLLRHLLVEAPGTYHHSILVANLAENAAHAVNANPLLVRVGAYYHDIGKIRRPYFFIENQMGGENPHDKLNPYLSTLIVTSHTKDGLEMAKAHRLPKEVQDIIVQHHGTRPVNYFYHQAVMKDGIENVNKDDFRHEGPKPQSKEAAILMLSDAVEAATRALQKPTASKIDQTVRHVIREIMLDGQLDESNLSFKELNILIETFIRLLTGMYHHRIEYPDMSKLSPMGSKTGTSKGKVFQFGN
jgi:putative nucleotidyltransferase with HDIG domain